MLKNLLTNRYRIFLFAHILIIVLVMLIFKFITDRKIAALFAGGLFVLSPLLVLFYEYRAKRIFKSLSSYSCILFLLSSALPIMYLRVANWTEDFSTLSLFGLSAPQLHDFSNKIFMLMLAAFVADAFREEIKRQKTTNIS